MRFLVMMLAAAATLTAAVAQPPIREPVREGNVERLVLDDGADVDAAVWVPAEATVAVDKQHAKRGETALRFHIDVNWETGEKAYPVGWPRMYRDWPPAAQDWRDFDYLDFSIYTTSSRTALPASPLGLILKGANRQNIYTRTLSELRLGEWVDYRLPLADIAGAGTMTGMQFFISESNYKHGDVLDFWIDNISLVRYVEPTAVSTKLPEAVIFADAAYLPLDLHLMGVAGGQKAEVRWQLRQGAGSAATGKLVAGRGKARVHLSLPAQGLKPGDYELVLRAGGDSLTFPLKVVSSPWQEVSK